MLAESTGLHTQAGRRAPDRPPVLLQAVVDGAARLAVDDLYLGGRSMGGRICSMAVADGSIANARGLVLVSYPLHPPGKPENLRTAHFPDLHVPCLFVSGTRDTFGRPDELEAATAAIPGDVTHVWIEGGDHGLRRKDAAVVAAISEWLAPRVGAGAIGVGCLHHLPRFAARCTTETQRLQRKN